MKYEALLIKKKNEKSLRLFTTQVKRWFVLDTDEGIFGYATKKGGRLKVTYNLKDVH
jgi:hypothetical protein